ncbi:MAG: hypothetical protein KF836_12350 [Fimbriimonadaceae bacterium]|nr:hypothetical protein [Fimbriimonadaceae bacterium]
MNIGLGVGFSSVTGLRSVEVTGANANQIPDIEKRLQVFRTVPWVQQSRASMATAILADNRIESASVVSNIFGRGKVTVTNRVPVAKVFREVKEGQAPPNWETYLDKNGVLYRGNSSEQVMPQLKLPKTANQVNLAIGAAWPLPSVAKVVTRVSSVLPELPSTLVLDDQSVLSLDVAAGPKIILGTDDDLDRKFEVLERAFRDDADRMKRVKVVNVSAPDRPTYTD